MSQPRSTDSYIKQVLDEEFAMTQYQRAAQRLKALGIGTAHLHAFLNTDQGRAMPSHITNNTYNALHRLENP
jgi:hypothetical protein